MILLSKRAFTSESVTEGHPDKICDQISDAILDAIIEKDEQAKVACETTVTTGMVSVMGEITTDCYVDISKIVRATIKQIGYDRPDYGFDGNTCAVITSLDEQSKDIALGVNSAFEQRVMSSTESADAIGAGDQGMMFGFACDETPELMPAPIIYAHRLSQQLANARKTDELPFLRPDGKTQVSVEYDNGKISRISTVVVSAQHSPDIGTNELRDAIISKIVKPTLPSHLLDNETVYLINPTGRFIIGGPVGDSGLTGRKIIVDTYGGYSSHGGGCFSGKDPTKVDRSGAYMARYVAKNIVAAGLAQRCQIEIAYAIGVANPVSLYIDTSGTSIVSDSMLEDAVRELFDFRPAEIIKTLDLRKPIYFKTASYGHFGRTDINLPWEKTDKVDALKRFF